MRFIVFIFTFVGFVYASNNVATKDDIKNLIYYMDKRFEQIDKRFEQIDKRFEQIDRRFDQIDRRFDQVDKRLDFHEKLIYILMGLVFASPFLAIYLKDRREEYMQKMLDNVKAILFVLRELASEDEKLAKKLKIAGLL